jgi:hypothetical protein
VEIHLHGVVNSNSFEIMALPAKHNQKTLKNPLFVDRLEDRDSLFLLFDSIYVAMLTHNGLDKNQWLQLALCR